MLAGGKDISVAIDTPGRGTFASDAECDIPPARKGTEAGDANCTTRAADAVAGQARCDRANTAGVRAKDRVLATNGTPETVSRGRASEQNNDWTYVARYAKRDRSTKWLTVNFRNEHKDIQHIRRQTSSALNRPAFRNNVAVALATELESWGDIDSILTLCG